MEVFRAFVTKVLRGKIPLPVAGIRVKYEAYMYNIPHNGELKPWLTLLRLLRTPTQYNMKQIVGAGGQVGEYYHLGIGSGIATKLASCKSNDNTLTLQFNFDGLPLSKSSSMEMWPILC